MNCIGPVERWPQHERPPFVDVNPDVKPDFDATTVAGAMISDNIARALMAGPPKKRWYLNRKGA